MFKSYPSQTKLDRIKAEFPTVEPIREQQHGMTVLSHMYVRLVGTDAAEAGSTTSTIVATAHAALKGDVINFTSGALSGKEYKVFSVSANAIVIAEDMSSAPGVGDAFQILRHKYPQVDASGNITVATTSGPVTFTRNGASQTVTEDTVTPANNRPLPVELLDSSGNINQVSVTTISGPVALPTGASTEATLSALNAKFNSLGQKTMAASAPVVIASDQTAIPASQSGTWNINNISGTISLPTGASTEATLSALNAKFNSLGQKTMAASAPVVLASDQTAIPVSQSGTWNINNISGTVSLPTGAATEATLSAINGKLNSLGQKTMANSVPVVIASDQTSISTTSGGRSVVTTVRNDYTSVNVTTGAWVQLVASTGATINEIEIFDSSGQTLELGTGAAAAETRLILVFPGGNGRVSVLVASGTRLSIRAVSATASSGELDLNLYG